MTENFPRCGYVAIVGRPNVGKSTLLNRLVGEKISITADKPQTTRHRLLGIKTVGQAQALYVDTPGIHRKAGRALNRYMNRVADATLSEVDVVVWVVEAMRWESEDDYVLERIQKSPVPVILVLNKVDTLADRRLLLPYMQMVAGKFEFRAIIPLSAQDGDNVDGLETTVLELLPAGDPLFPEDQLTDRSSRFLAAELVREKLTRRLGAEVPYRLSVEIEQFAEEEKLLRISALIWVERPSQKSIVIGKNGHVLKTIGSQARHDMEKLFGNKVFLQLWVKVKDDWSDSEQALRELGYESSR